MQARPLLVLAVCATQWAVAEAGAGVRSNTKVSATVSASKADPSGTRRVTVELKIEDGWHLYANPTENAGLAANQTTLTVLTGKGKQVDAKIDYPEGLLKKDKLTGEHKIYKDRIMIQAVVPNAGADALKLRIRVCACSDEKMLCLVPGEVLLSVP